MTLAGRYNSEALQAIETASSQGASLQTVAELLTPLRTNEFAAAKTTAEKQMASFTFPEPLLFFQGSNGIGRQPKTYVGVNCTGTQPTAHSNQQNEDFQAEYG